jgi:template-activating factor I
VQHFSENPYFSDSVLEKKFELKKGLAAAPADGSVTKEMREYVDEELVSSVSA